MNSVNRARFPAEQCCGPGIEERQAAVCDKALGREGTETLVLCRTGDANRTERGLCWRHAGLGYSLLMESGSHWNHSVSGTCFTFLEQYQGWEDWETEVLREHRSRMKRKFGNQG